MSGSLDPIFRPRSIAVIGASRDQNTIGRAVVENLVKFGFTGIVYPVNPKAEVIFSIKAYPSVEDIPGDVDLAIIAVPARFVPEVMEACGRKGVKGAIIITAGFREMGADGMGRESALRDIVDRYGIRVIGPNCMGVLNTDPAIRMNATFAYTSVPEGNVALISQSGAFGLIIFEHTESMGLGMSKFISLGNRMDVGTNELLEMLERDERTNLILLYLESFGDPRQFPAIARRISRKKPIIAVKSGRTSAGAKAASSHTGAMAASDIAVEALFEQAGILRARTIPDLFDYAQALAYQPLPKGDRVAIITNGGGPAIIATDAVIGAGLKMAAFSDTTLAALRSFLPPEASTANPVDMIASAGPEEYRKAVAAALGDGGVDAVIVIFVPPIAADSVAVAKAISGASAGIEKPVLGVFMGSERVAHAVEELERNRIPPYKFPESAANSLAAMHRYAQWMRRPIGEPTAFPVDRDAVRRIIRGRSGYLGMEEVRDLLEAYGLRIPEFSIVRTKDEACAEAERLGYPVVLKALVRGITHKTDIGGIKLDLRTEYEVKGGFYDILESLREAGLDREKDLIGVMVQRMVDGGKETIIGVVQDPLFGPLVMFGMGGIYVEVLKDVAFRIPPLTDRDAMELVESIRGYPILKGIRGDPPHDIPAAIDALQRVSQMVIENPEIVEMDLNPFLILPEGEGVTALDARIRVEPCDEGTPSRGQRP
ncbi:MAG: acetate--CoA ligase family protein [Thermoplasmata archaeon]|nr:acetate--CoA ligase family protein [Thermoplasmata archaeon]